MAARKSYNKTFKEEAVLLAEKSGVTQVASDLGIHLNMIYTWKRQLAGNGDKVFPGNGNPTHIPRTYSDSIRSGLPFTVTFLFLLGLIKKPHRIPHSNLHTRGCTPA